MGAAGAPGRTGSDPGAWAGKVADEFYTRNDQAILFTLAQQAAIALARARLVDELKGRFDEVQALSRQLLALQERNQQRMALELHDQVVQDVLFVRQLLDSALRDAAPAKVIEGARDELLRIAGYLDTLIFELRPPELEQGELGQILQQVRRQLSEEARSACGFPDQWQQRRRCAPGGDQAGRVPHLPGEPEQCPQARRGASQVEASLDVQHDRVRLEVHDDGVGFEVPAHLGGWIDANRLGLLGMRARAEEVGGRLRVTSQPGQGTHVLLDVPLPAC